MGNGYELFLTEDQKRKAFIKLIIALILLYLFLLAILVTIFILVLKDDLQKA